MMKRILFIFAAILVLMSSCSKQEDGTGLAFGKVSLGLSVDGLSKAAGDDLSSYTVTIAGTTHKGKSFSQDWVWSEMPDSVTLPYGRYTASAVSCSAGQAVSGYGQALYSGQSVEFLVRSASVESVEIVCTLHNAIMTVVFDDSFNSVFDTAGIEFSHSGRKVALTGAEAAAGTKLYFSVGDGGDVLDYTVRGSIDGVEHSYPGTFFLKPGQWGHLTVRSGSDGFLGPQVSVDTEYLSNEITEVLDKDE